MKTFHKVIGLLVLSVATLATQAMAQPYLIASDNFDRPDGSLTGSTPTPGPGSDWTSHSGTLGDLLISSGQAVVQHGAPSEDTHVVFTAQDTGVLYATFDITVNDDTIIGQTATSNGTDFEYFAHFLNDPSNNFTARLDIVAPNDTGDYTLGIATTSGTAEATFATDFSFGVTYTVTLAYDFGTGLASVTAGGTTITSTTAGTVTSLDSFAFRQSDSTNNETILVDNLEIYGNTEPPPPPAILIPELQPSLSGSDLDITFETEADVFYRLQSSTGLSGFSDVPGQAVVGTGSPETFTEAAPATGEKAFYQVEVLETTPAPEVFGISKVFAGIGETVTVTGSNLEVATAVTINSVSASFSVSGGDLVVTVPVGAGTGVVEVTTPGGTASSEFVVNTDTAPLIYTQEFVTGLDDFTTFSVASSANWTAGSFFAENYIGINGFGADTASNDWLISPAFDLSLLQNSYFIVGHGRRFDGPALAVQISTDYTGGDPTLATWVPVTVTLSPGSGADFVVVDSGKVDISAYDGQTIYIAIQYTSIGTAGGEGAWDLIHYFAVGGDPAL